MDSSSQAARVFATLFIWGAITILGIGAFVNSIFLGGGAVVVIMIILGIAAASATQAVWKSGGVHDQNEAEKAKRRGKVERLLGNLDDQEIDELRARLMGENDGESVSLEELMEARRQGRS